MANLSKTARKIFDLALADCSIEQAMARRVSVHDGCLSIDNETIALAGLEHLRVIVVGKAAGAMLEALWHLLPQLPDCEIAGVAIAREHPSQLPERFQYFTGGHPAPTEASFAGARAALADVRFAAGRPAHALCLFLISGGASAMMELPLDGDISPGDTADFHRALVGSGASITEINCVRKHFSAVKGGRLALAAGDARCHSLLVSDVPAGCEDALGSGPTLADRSTVAECREILKRYDLAAHFPAPVRRFFEAAELPETPKPDQLKAAATVLLSSQDLAEAAARRAVELGWTAVIDNSCDDWDYQEAARYLLKRVRELRGRHSRVCLISAGEVGVALAAKGKVGVGGRNEQFAVYAATLIRPEDGEIAILSAGSDGVDGNSPAAGGVVDERTLAEPGPREAAVQALERFDCHPFLMARGAAVVTGPTGNNLRDLRVVLAAEK